MVIVFGFLCIKGVIKFFIQLLCIKPVSYTHLDVYKRQLALLPGLLEQLERLHKALRDKSIEFDA